MSVYFLPVASPIHVGKVRPIAEAARRLLQDAGMDVRGPETPVVRVEDAKVPVGVYDLLVVFVASGGASSIAAEASRGKRAILWAYPENNSLPSALNARAKLKASGEWRGEIVYGGLDENPPEILAEAKAANAVKRLQGARVGVLCGAEGWKRMEGDAKRLKELLGVDTVYVDLEDVKKMMADIGAEDAHRTLEQTLKDARYIHLSPEDAAKAVRFYLALKSVVDRLGLAGVAVDCFRLLQRIHVTPCIPLSLLCDVGLAGVCEGDLEAAASMLVLTCITGRPAWIANLAQVDFNRNTITLAHCTAATKLGAEAPRVLPHFETGLPISLDVPLRAGEVTLAHIQLGSGRLIAARGVLVRSGMGKPGLCRTQAVVRLQNRVQNLLQEAGRHLVLAHGDLLETLRRFSRRTGLEFTPT